MITLKDFLETIQYKITGGSEYQWKCFGYNARFLDCDLPGRGAHVIFDSNTQLVYSAEVFDYANARAYMWLHPAFKDEFVAEAKQRGIDYLNAFDDIRYTELEVEDDWLEKATAIMSGKEYDTRIQVPLTLGDDELFQLMKLAHERDITLNQMVEVLLRLAIEKEKLNG